MSGVSGISKALLLKSPATRPSAVLPRFPCPPLHLGSPSTDLIHSTLASPLPAGFLILPRFFDWGEQQILLSAALERLERLGGVRRRAGGAKRRSTKAELQARRDQLQGQGQGLEGWFRDESEYAFQTGHMDSVTHHYREAAISSPIPPAGSHPAFSPTPSDLLARLNFLFPLPPKSAESGDSDPQPAGPRIQTHLLHLAQLGWIGPHVDNKESMGNVLVGVCLGGERVLRLERAGLEGEEKTVDGRVDILLESGTVYVQSDEVRNDFEHSILPPPESPDYPADDPPAWTVAPRQRMSIILRDLPPSTAVSNITTDPLSPAFYNPLGDSLPLAYDPLSAADELYLTLPPKMAARLQRENEDALDSVREQYYVPPSKQEASYARRTRDGATLSGHERIKAGMRNRKWGGK